jgi:hypothetical protein
MVSEDLCAPCDVRSEMFKLHSHINIQTLAAIEEVARDCPATMSRGDVVEKLRHAINRRLGKHFIAASTHVVIMKGKTATGRGRHSLDPTTRPGGRSVVWTPSRPDVAKAALRLVAELHGVIKAPEAKAAKTRCELFIQTRTAVVETLSLFEPLVSCVTYPMQSSLVFRVICVSRLREAGPRTRCWVARSRVHCTPR